MKSVELIACRVCSKLDDFLYIALAGLLFRIDDGMCVSLRSSFLAAYA